MGSGKKHRHGQRRPQGSTKEHADEGREHCQDAFSPLSAPRFLLGFILLSIAAVSSGLLVMQHFVGASIPGCAAGGACDRAAESIWGSIPGLGWPVSFLGFAYFGALLVAWPLVRAEGVAQLRWPVRLGALASALYLIVIVAGDYACPYCLVSHAGNLGFLILLETARPRGFGRLGRLLQSRTVPRLAVGFVSITIILAGWMFLHAQRVEERAQRDLEASTRQIAESDEADGEAFAGRYRRGPERAAIRIVVFTGYQCPECQRLEHQIDRLLEERDDLSFSVKHFPLNPDCNPHIARAVHGNACWAARAVEAAGILYGEEGFWRMHDWMVERRGGFTDAALSEALQRFGFDQRQFLATMMAEATLERVRADADEAVSLGISATPMVFINGVELRGTHASGAIRSAVERVAATNPEPRSAAADRPPDAFTRSVEEWRDGEVKSIPEAREERRFGDPEAPIRIEVWGDYLNARSKELDRKIRQRLEEDWPDVRYAFRSMPLDESCNDLMARTVQENGCLVAHAMEAIADVGGRDGYREMHRWIMDRDAPVTGAELNEMITRSGMDVSDWVRRWQSANVRAAVQEQIQVGDRVSSRLIVPLLFIDGRWAPRWELEEEDLLGALVEEARRQRRDRP